MLTFKQLPAGIRSQFIQLFHSPEMIGWDTGYESGRFDSRRAARVATGSASVFKRRWEVDETKSNVLILIDLSGSMDERMGGRVRAEVAFELAYAMAECLDAAGVTNEVYGFRVNGSGFGSALQAGNSLKGEEAYDYSARASGARLYRCKKAGERAVNKQQAFAQLAASANAGTPDYAAVRGAVEILARDKGSTQKICLVLTDGEGDAQPAGIASISQIAERNGILLAGIGIGYDVTGVYPVSARCDSVETLNASVIKTLKDAAGRTQKARQAAMRAG